MTSALMVVDNRYLLRDNALLFTVMDERYLEPILEEISKIIVEKSVDVGFAVLAAMTDILPEGVLRKSNDFDHSEFALKRRTEEAKKSMGTKHTCGKCFKKFYDFNRNFFCPVCAEPLPSACI